MKHQKLLLIALASFLPTLVACGDDGGGDGAGTPDAADVVTPDAAPPDANNQVARDSTFHAMAPPHAEIAGSTITLTQDPDNNQIFVDGILATGLPEGEIVTLWFGAYNKTAECLTPKVELGSLCFAPDILNNAAVEGALMASGSTGFVTVPTGGEIAFPKLTLAVTAVGAADDLAKQLGVGNGLNDLAASEIHVYLQKHGVPLTGDDLLSQQSNFNGGCRAGEANENIAGTCALIQVAVFAPTI